MTTSAAASIPPLLPPPATSRKAPEPSRMFACNNFHHIFISCNYTTIYLWRVNSRYFAFKTKALPALGICSSAEPMENSVFCKHILVIERPNNFREQLHQLSILIALHLNFVYQLQLKLPIRAEGIQQLCPCFHLHFKFLTNSLDNNEH